MVEYPIVWELFGGVLIGFAYFAVAYVSFVPARINSRNLRAFTRSAARLLSAASDDDRAAFADDLLRGPNFERLVGYSGAWQKAERHGALVEFDRLRSIGAPLQFTGRPPISAFYLFAHRRELEAASTAGTFLQILSDPEFCSVLVRKCPWLTADMLNVIANKRLHADQANAFIQEIGRQAITSEESMLAKESSYTGFGAVPLLSRSLFGNWFILHHYDPMWRLGFSGSGPPSPGFLNRLNAASEIMLETAIGGKEYWSQEYMRSVERAYESLSRHWAFTRPKALPIDFLVAFNSGVRHLYQGLLGGLEKLEPSRRRTLYATDPKAFQSDLVATIAKTTYDSVECFANTFTGPDDEAWLHAIGVFLDIFPPHSSEAGMNPLQQQIALQLVKKLQDNMEGWYPAISRVLLSVIGPYETLSASAPRSAHTILKDAVYKELQKLPSLYAKHPEKFADFFPANVTFDPSSNSITHSYRDGSAKTTNLSALDIADVDLTDKCNWLVPALLANEDTQSMAAS